MLHLIRRLLVQKDGASAIEYAFVAMLISMVIIAGITIAGTQLSGTFNKVGQGFANAS